MIQISATKWSCSTDCLEQLVAREHEVRLEPMASGLEAEVTKLLLEQEAYVWKVWNRDSKPDINRQFHLLHALIDSGVQVSVPIGWGVDPDGNAVLVTSHDGLPPKKLDNGMLSELAERLVDLHRMPIDNIAPELLPAYDFVGYFFPNIEAHGDLHERLLHLMDQVGYRYDRLIHGDFNSGNVVFDNGKCTIIDWTNGQMGDPRYDYAWACALLRIYASERHAEVFRNAYVAAVPLSLQEEQAFEAIAVIRWLLLNRLVGLLRQSTTKSKARSILKGNPYLAGLTL
ncbi:aminoglycoside phosphotransferase family protein [Paenibacillus sp. PR3]|uniref:Aminoglycoside phosphotransferase family protein n=1 Tax=Paenibacillus terricola TaxID=2763503 RepID=A0ABR8MTN2_9BACL|nr:aminoglycoside phosphotransferase family protein [Paenibacillus terricola]MBD3917879.1 aminoglycoside phosphotransferase family protein [Paenibacillus terricola]